MTDQSLVAQEIIRTAQWCFERGSFSKEELESLKEKVGEKDKLAKMTKRSER